jgi:hypothetical protein
MSDVEILESRFPEIRWSEPVPVTVTGVVVGALCCRVCIALYGLRGRDVSAWAFNTRAEFDEHFREHL